jgi:hypothetical protein
MRNNKILLDIKAKINTLESKKIESRRVDKLPFLKELDAFLSKNSNNIPCQYAKILEPDDIKKRKRISNVIRGQIVDWNIFRRLKNIIPNNF